MTLLQMEQRRRLAFKPRTASASAAASSAARQAFQQVSNPVPKWWGSSGGQEAPAPAPQQQATPQPQAPPQMAPQQQGGSKAARDRYPAAAREFDQLVELIKRVTADLEREFRAEVGEEVATVVTIGLEAYAGNP